MRRLSAVLLAAAAAAALACSGPGVRLQRAGVEWMEWPAAVAAATPFTVRLVVMGTGCDRLLSFVATPSIDVSAVTFEPYFLIEEEHRPCLAEGLIGVVDNQPQVLPAPAAIVYFDTTATVGGLIADAPRTYEVRAAAGTFSSPGSALPIRTFGDITVGGAELDRTQAGGNVFAARGTDGCLRIHPPGVVSGYVVENPPDATQYWSAFVRGYLHEPAEPVCGASRVFHLVAKT